MILIADASALVALSACDSLALLDALFGQVGVPEAVFNEVRLIAASPVFIGADLLQTVLDLAGE